MKHVLAALALTAAVVSAAPARAGAPPAPAFDAANCQWLKITVSARMVELLDDDAGLGARRGSRAVCYLQLVYSAPDPNNPDAPNGTYSGPVLCQDDGNGDWVMSGPDDSLIAKVLPGGDAVGIDNYMTFKNEAGDVIQGFGSHWLHFTVDATGKFRSATFQTLAGELLDGSVFFLDAPTASSVMGSYTSKGGSVPVTKVPPGAVALVTPSPCSP